MSRGSTPDLDFDTISSISRGASLRFVLFTFYRFLPTDFREEPIFSWNLTPETRYYSGQKAKEAFDKIDKRGAWYIDWFKDDRVHQIIPELKNADCFDRFAEVYVVGKNCEWTYIKTHESSCGPYFMKR